VTQKLKPYWIPQYEYAHAQDFFNFSVMLQNQHIQAFISYYNFL